MTLKSKFILCIVVGIFVPSILISTFSYILMRNDLMHKESVRLENLAEDALVKIDMQMKARERELHLLASMGVITSSFEYDIFDQADDLLKEFVKNLPMYHQIHLLNSANEIVASSDPASKGQMTQHKADMQGGVSFSQAYRDESNKLILIDIFQMVYLDGKAVGTLIAEYNIDDTFQVLDNIKVVKEGQIESGHLMVFNSQGIVFYAPSFERAKRNNVLKENLKDSGMLSVSRALAGDRGAIKEKGEHGERVLAGFIFNDTSLLKLGAFALHTEDSILSQARKVFRGVAILVVALLVLGCAIAAYVGNKSATPINIAVSGLTTGAERIFTAAAQVASSSQSLSESSSDQAASIEETTASMEEMSSMTRQNAENASQANALMKNSIEIIRSADVSMSEMSDSMVEISEASEETSKIVKTIDEIAFQTNLLALNAAVEAARAGEAGAGFAVVADEVRNLAMRAAEAARTTSELIEGTVHKVNNGKEIVIRANNAFKEVAESSTKVDSLISEITNASQEQAHGFDQINKAVVQMDNNTQQNSALADQSSNASQDLNEQAEELIHMIESLRLVVDGRKASASKSSSVNDLVIANS